MGVPILRIVKGHDRVAVVNLLENPSFEIDTTGYSAGSGHAIGRSRARSLHGDYSCLFFYLNTPTTLITHPLTSMTQGKSYVASARIYVPSSWAGDDIRLALNGFSDASASGSVHIWTSSDPYDEWFTISAYVEDIGFDVAGSLDIEEQGSNPGFGDYFWTDSWQLEEVVNTPSNAGFTPYCDGSLEGCEWNGTAHASTSFREASDRQEVSLLGSIFYLNETRPQIAQYKSGGTYSSSPFADGRQLIDTKYDNVIETYNLKVVNDDQDAVANSMQKIRDLLVSGVKYWTDDWEDEGELVWLEARAANETNTRYAVVKNGSIPEDENPWSTPFLQHRGRAVMDNIDLIIERDHWLGNPPGEGEPVALSAVESYETGLLVVEELIDVSTVPTMIVSDLAALIASSSISASDVPTVHVITTAISNYGKVSDDATAIHATTSINLNGDISFGHDGSGIRDAGTVFSPVGVPAGATILSAYVNLTASLTDTYTPTIRIYVEDADTAATFSTYANFTGRTKIGPILWNTTAWTSGVEYTTPNLASIVQNVVDRGGWDASTLAFIFDGSLAAASDLKTAIALDTSIPATRPELVIMYHT